jgi:hypothetical protein
LINLIVLIKIVQNHIQQDVIVQWKPIAEQKEADPDLELEVVPDQKIAVIAVIDVNVTQAELDPIRMILIHALKVKA